MLMEASRRSAFGKTVLGIWEFFFLLGSGSLVLGIIFAGRVPSLTSSDWVTFYWGLGTLTTYAFLKRWPGRYALFVLLSIIEIVVVGALIYIFLIEVLPSVVSERASPLAPICVVLLGAPKHVAFVLLCWLVARSRASECPARDQRLSNPQFGSILVTDESD